MGCTFCLTGRSGLIRNLTAAEILSQVTEARHDVEKNGLRITNIVFMGMGEPLHNIKHVLPALEYNNVIVALACRLDALPSAPVVSFRRSTS